MSPLCALVIDDEQIVLDSVEKILGAEGFTVETAIRSSTGLNRALNRNYDIVLTDIRMPEIGGMRILRDVKRAKPTVPVLIITGYATVHGAVQAMKLGAADYVEKPFTPEELLAAVRKTLEKARTEEPEAQTLVHRAEMLRVLEKAAVDAEFVSRLFYDGADALRDFTLTRAEKLAILTGDVQWIESQTGTLTPVQRRWLDQRLSAEIW